MDANLDYCLKRFAEEQLIDNMKLTAKLERNLQRRRTRLTDIVPDEEATIHNRESVLLQQFCHDLSDNNIALHKTRQIIEDLFEKALNDIKTDINTISQVPLMRNDNEENNEEIRTANNKIRQQIARIDSELTHIFKMIDYSNSPNCSSHIMSWFRIHYGYANQLNRMVGKNTSAGDLLVFSENSPLMQCILNRIELWEERRNIIGMFIYELNENAYLFDSLYHMMDTSGATKFIRLYIQNRQKERRRLEEQQLRKLESDVQEQSISQQIITYELINILCQLTKDPINEFYLNKKLKMSLSQSTKSKLFVPIFADKNKETKDLLLMLRLEIDYQNWVSNTDFIQQYFSLALCKTLKIPSESLRIERVKDNNDQLQVIISSSIGQSVLERILGNREDKNTLMMNIAVIEKCCAKFNTQLSSIVMGDIAFVVGKQLINLQSNRIHINIIKSMENIYSLYSFDEHNQTSLCPEGWKRFDINISKNKNDNSDVEWNSWPIAYLGTQSSLTPFILASSLCVSSHRYCTFKSHQTICLSPNIEHAAHSRYTRIWKRTDDDEKHLYYQLIFQCRVNPNALSLEKEKTVCIDNNVSNDKFGWIVKAENDTLEYFCNNIVCFGLMIRITNNEPQ